MSNLISTGTKIMAERLNLTYQEMEQVEKIYFQIPKEQRTMEVLKQLAEEIKQVKSQPQNNPIGISLYQPFFQGFDGGLGTVIHH